MITIGLLMAAGGCDTAKGPDVERGRASLTAALKSLKCGEPSKVLQQHAPPIEFTEDPRQKGDKLVGYEILDCRADGEKVRFQVRLELQNKRGQKSTREASYAIAPGGTVVIARDPYF